MIGSLRGPVLDWRPRAAGGCEALVEVGGVGYRVVVPTGTEAKLGPVGTLVFLHVHTHVREDAIVLFGFTTRQERECFEALIGSHGVGPSLALALLSVHSPMALRRAVECDDTGALTLVPGIGAKTAARLIVELKSRLDLDLDDPGLRVVDVSTHAGGVDADRAAVRSDVRTALASLGYGVDEIRHAMSGLPDNASVEDQVRLALRDLAASR